jgi:hypothetical protein
MTRVGTIVVAMLLAMPTLAAAQEAKADECGECALGCGSAVAMRWAVSEAVCGMREIQGWVLGGLENDRRHLDKEPGRKAGERTRGDRSEVDGRGANYEARLFETDVRRKVVRDCRVDPDRCFEQACGAGARREAQLQIWRRALCGSVQVDGRLQGCRARDRPENQEINRRKRQLGEYAAPSPVGFREGKWAMESC